MADAIPGVKIVSIKDLLEMAGLATMSMLKRHRLQLAEGQQPAAQYWGRDYVALYRASDAVPMPALSPARQRLYSRARTCAECGVTSTDPLYMGPDRRLRYCMEHVEPAWKQSWDSEQAVRRLTSAVWAREVLSDRTAIILTSEPIRSGRIRPVRIETIAGDVLLDVRIRKLAGLEGSEIDGTISVDAGRAALLDAVARRRIIATITAGPMDVAWRIGRWLGIDDLHGSVGDSYIERRSAWVGERRVSEWRGTGEAPHSQYRDICSQSLQAESAASQAAEIRAGLIEMAETL